MVLLTKEEKEARKKAKLEEKLKQENELMKQLNRDRMNFNIQAQAKIRKSLEQKWHNMMLRIKEPLFQKDVNILWHTFERLYDRKDFYIESIMHLIEVGEDQYQKTIAGFCDSIDTMIIKFLGDLEHMESRYKSRLKALNKFGEETKAKIIADHDAAETHLQLLIFYGNKVATDLKWNTKGEFMVAEDEDRNRFFDEREQLCFDLETAFSNMWTSYKTVLKAYVIGTAENQKNARKLRHKDIMMADIIASQSKRISGFDETLKRLRNDLTNYESGSKQAQFRERRERYRAAFKRLKQKMLNALAIDEKQLLTLVQASDAALEWLEAAHKKGEKILRLAALCRKFETQKEKVLPFGTDSPIDEEEEETVTRKFSGDLLISAAVSDCDSLKKLWQKIARAELTKRALYRENMILEKQNAHLEEQLQNRGEVKLDKMGIKQCFCRWSAKRKPLLHPVSSIDGVAEFYKYRMSL